MLFVVVLTSFFVKMTSIIVSLPGDHPWTRVPLAARIVARVYVGIPFAYITPSRLYAYVHSLYVVLLFSFVVR